MNPINEPVKNGKAETLDTPAERLVIRLLPIGKNRINRVILNGFSLKKLSIRNH